MTQSDSYRLARLERRDKLHFQAICFLFLMLITGLLGFSIRQSRKEKLPDYEFGPVVPVMPRKVELDSSLNEPVSVLDLPFPQQRAGHLPERGALGKRYQLIRNAEFFQNHHRIFLDDPPDRDGNSYRIGKHLFPRGKEIGKYLLYRCADGTCREVEDSSIARLE